MKHSHHHGRHLAETPTNASTKATTETKVATSETTATSEKATTVSTKGDGTKKESKKSKKGGKVIQNGVKVLTQEEKDEKENNKVHDAFFTRKQHSSATHGTKSISMEDQNNIEDMYNAKVDDKTKAAYANRHPPNPFEKKKKKKKEVKKEVKLDATAMQLDNDFEVAEKKPETALEA